MCVDELRNQAATKLHTIQASLPVSKTIQAVNSAFRPNKRDRH